MKQALKALWEFHTTYGAAASNVPTIVDDETFELRKKLIEEEYKEFLEGHENRDIVEVADALADLAYVVIGTAVSYGIPLDVVFDEVHRSNMSKLGEDGKPIYREDGKVLKGPNYFKPNIKSIIDNCTDSQPK